MALVTLQVLEGLERGRMYSDLPTPITIGREDENAVRLNDERVSRFHAKIQEDSGRIILTDLDSTNGTRVNGHPVQMRILQIGDQLMIGRCLLVFGSPEQIADRAAELSDSRRQRLHDHDEEAASPSDGENDPSDSDLEREFQELWESLPGGRGEACEELFPGGPPALPDNLPPAQRAEFSDYLAYLHDQIRAVLLASTENSDSLEQEFVTMQMDWMAWQRLLKLEMDLAVALRRLADPESES